MDIAQSKSSAPADVVCLIPSSEEKNAPISLVAKEENKGGSFMRYASLWLLMAQNTGFILLMRYTRTRNIEQLYLTSVAVLVSEFIKLLACFAVVWYENKWNFLQAMIEIHRHVIAKPIETLKVAFPALVYTVQNNLLFISISHLDAATFQVSYQLKIFTAAVFSVIILKKKLSVLQWIALVLLFSGVSLVQVSNLTTPSDSSASMKSIDQTTTVASGVTKVEQNYLFGISCALGACVLSGYAGVYFEQVLKGSETSLWIRNIQLAGLSVPLALCGALLYDYETIWNHGFFQGFDFIVWFTLAFSSFGGLLVAVVLKYADNILKGFATSGGVVLAVVLSYLIFSTTISLLFAVGAALVVTAVYVYSAYPATIPK